MENPATAAARQGAGKGFFRSPTGMAITATVGVGAIYYFSVRADQKSKNDHGNQQAKLDEHFHPKNDGNKAGGSANIRSVN